MTLNTVYETPVSLLVTLAAYLLFLGQCYQVLLTVAQKRRGHSLPLALLHALLGLLFLYLLLDGSYLRAMYTPPLLTRMLYRIPLPFILFLQLLSLALLTFCLRDSFRYRRTHLTFSSIKEAMDQLPAGICFCDRSGNVILANLEMDRLSRQLNGRMLTNADMLWACVEKSGAPSNEAWFVRFPDERAFLFTRTPLQADGESFEQILAVDVTAQSKLTETLDRIGLQLRDQQIHMRLLAAQNAALLTSQEILRARTAFHDQFAGVLLSGKYFLDHPDTGDREALRLMVENTNRMFLQQAEETQAHADLLESAPAMCQRIGVTLSLDGSLPDDPTVRNILAHAVIECAANTVKHAGGTALFLRLRHRRRGLEALLENDGNPPGGEFKESGGLLSLRRLAEKEGAVMTVTATPRFQLTLTFPPAI